MKHASQVDFVFLLQPRDARDIYRKYPFARFIPSSLLMFIFHLLPPVVVARIKGTLKDNGTGKIKEVNGAIVSITTTAETMLKDRILGRKKVEEGVIFANKKLGARYVGLGSLTSPIVGGGVDLSQQRDVYITNGNALTAAMTIEGILTATKLANLDLSKTTVGIVGATGSIGQAVAKMLAEDCGVSRLVLVGRTPQNLEGLQKELREISPEADISISTNISAISKSMLVVVATSAANAIISEEHLAQGAVVYDITQPQNVPERIKQTRPDVRVIDGALVTMPDGLSIRFDLGVPNGQTFSCLAETILIANQDEGKDFSVGHVRVDQARFIRGIALAHGFAPAPLTSFGEKTN